MNAEKLPVKCADCGTLKWANAVTNVTVCPVCELGFSPKEVEGYENSSQGVLVEKSMCEAQEYEREECAKLCDEESKEHTADSVELEEKGLLSLANNAFDRAMECGSLAAKIRERQS